MKAGVKVLLMVGAVVLLFAVVVLAAEGASEGELSTWQMAVASVVGTVVGIPIVQIIKTKWFPNIDKKLLRIVAYVVAFVLAVVTFAITGGLRDLLSNWMVLITQGSSAFAMMTVIYTLIADALGLSRE